MALPRFPIPDLEVTLQEASRVLQLSLKPEEYSRFTSTLCQQKEALLEAHHLLVSTAAGSENWVTEQFKTRLLSCGDPLPTSTAIPAVLPSSGSKLEQVDRAAALLWAVAKLHSEPWLLEGDEPTERTQQSEGFASSRLPGKTQDHIKVYPESLHVIVLSKGGIFPVQVLKRSSISGTLTPLPFVDIYLQVVEVASQPAASDDDGTRSICYFTGLQRQTWHGIREQILSVGGASAESLGMMESAILALALEDCQSLSDLAEILTVLRLGSGDGHCQRYYDKVVNLVVFQDGTAGMLFEHSALDGMVSALLVEKLWSLSESFDLSELISPTCMSAKLQNTIQSRPKQLYFTLGTITKLSFFSPATSINSILTFDITSYPDVFSTLRGHRGLFDTWINFSLQLALRQTLGESDTNHILVTPTHMRHFKHGRCDPSYTVTTQSRDLIDSLMSCRDVDNCFKNPKELLSLFHNAFQEHKCLIKNTKSGQGVGPHLAALRSALDKENPLKEFLDAFGSPSVYLTGKDLMDKVDCAVGNVYATDQLAVSYLGRRDAVRLVLNGKGSFGEVINTLKENLKGTLKLVMLLALRYAIAVQMGALQCWLQNEAQIGHNKSGNKDISKNKTPDFVLVIHGGAGEEIILNQKVISIIEFSLQSALFLGAEKLLCGGTSIEAVEKSVAALEDCFFFNAGKGSVYSGEGSHELEASIIDGNKMRCGSVACLQKIKNPIKAAKKVMENSPHGLLVGDGAEAFLKSLEDSEIPVAAEYFHTDVRWKELEMMKKVSNKKNNHPQTVGAVALDSNGKLAAATSTGGVVGKLKGRVGDVAIVGAGIYADSMLAVTCSGDGDLFLRHSVAQKVASLYHLRGYSLSEACQEVIDNLEGDSAGIIAVNDKGEAVMKVKSGVMFVGSVIRAKVHVEVLRPVKIFSYVIWQTEDLVAYLHDKPWTPGATVLSQKRDKGTNSIFKLPQKEFLSMMLGATIVANVLCEQLAVHRCALVSKPHPKEPAHIRVLPLHGLESKWKPHLAEKEEFHPYDPGYCSSKSGPRWEDSELEKIQAIIRSQLPTVNKQSSYKFLGNPCDNNLFSRIVRGEIQHWRVWEDDSFVAFLTPFPNTPGFTVLVPRKPLTSDVLRLEKNEYTNLVLATQKVAQLLEDALGAHGVALIFEGFEIDYAHAKLIPLLSPLGNCPFTTATEFCHMYQGYVTSADGPLASPESLAELHTKIIQCKPPRSWEDPEKHAAVAIKSPWYHYLFQIQNTLFHSTVEFFHYKYRYAYALTPLTTDTISSPMGLGSDSEPVSVSLLGQDVYLADSMQFVLEYFLRFQEGLPGTYYISQSFRGEDPDSTHLNQFYHVECELLGNMENAMHVAEGYVAHLTRAMLHKHSDMILKSAGTLSHAEQLLMRLESQDSVPCIPLEQAILMMPSEDCMEWVQEGQPEYGRKLTRKGERVLIEKYGGAVWLTEMDHLAVAFYQAYLEGSGKCKAKAADLLLGLGETLGLGERHSTPELVQEALRHHAVPEESYKWYINMRQIKPLITSGWGMGTERYLCWLLKHDDVRDMHIIPRMKTRKYMP